MQKSPKEKKEIKNASKDNNIKNTDTLNNTKKVTTKKTSKTSNTKKSTTNKTNKTSETINTTKSIKASPTHKNKTKKDTHKKNKKSTSNTNKTAKKQNTIIEYYDLPTKYNQTIVKILAQTPKTLFIYWEISDDDIKNYKKQYGENFFEKTKPVLIIHNNTLNYSFEVEINDFANSWYLHINDSKSDYKVELGRRPIEKNNNMNLDYLYISSSNEIESPNDHILFNPSQKMVYFRNVKTYQKIEKTTSSLSFIQNMGKIYNIYDLYKELYKNQDDFDYLSNPSSQFK